LYQSLRPQLLADGRPLVLAVEEFLPIALGLLPRDELVERGDVEDDAIVEVRFEVQVRRPPQLVLEVPQFGQELLLPLDLLAEPLGFSPRVASGGFLGAERFEAAVLQPDLRFNIVLL